MTAVWGAMTAEEIIVPIKGTWISGVRETALAGLSIDSRTITPGRIFWALKGEQYDGHDFALKAVEQGAVGVVLEKNCLKSYLEALEAQLQDPVIIAVDDSLKALGDLAGWWRRQHNARLVAITGSAGKTTVKEMTSGVLERCNKTLKNQGNFNNLIGLPLSLLHLEEGHVNAVLEMGMNRPGEIARLTEIANPDVGLITNVGMAHLEGLGSIEGVAKAKVELVEKISSNGKVIVNGDDEILLKAASVFRKDLITFGIGKENKVRAANIRNLGLEGITFDLEYEGGAWPVILKVPGIQNISNALAAAAVGLCSKESPEQIVEGLGAFMGVKGRFTVSSLPGNIVLVNDTYNANPSSLKAALESVEALVGEGRRIIVGLGEMMELGDSALSAHREAGRMVAQLQARCLLAMGEHAQEVVRGAVESGGYRNFAEIVKTHEDMAGRIKQEMREGDLIFLKGSRKIGIEKVIDVLEE
ncbi:MAG: UDP-N-acetylmuramoyl-tripeptide--D-alanyl-D-alanine ligase [Desulfobacterales bacterium]|nr:UDP-N-acetylmuramoyl-tripeptide--D-alanyl-D-alanine ligase [Desulfobacterales bacterium]